MLHNKYRPKHFRILFVGVIILLSALFGLSQRVMADEEQDKLNNLNETIEEYEREVLRLNDEANTISNQVSQYNAQINLTSLKIDQTEQKINVLGGRIELLETSLSTLTDAFTSRANQTYKLARLNDEPYLVFLGADNLSDAVSSFYYLEKIQEADRDLLLRLEKAQFTYEGEKDDQEDLQIVLEDQKKDLDSKKAAKAKLLQITRNDEKRYQGLLVQARAELDAIQAIISGRGDETKVGEIGEGERIASITPGSSTCSSGGHLHFEVVKDNYHQNPANYLIPKEIIWDNAPDGPLVLAGGWQWPINDPIRITQGFGMTYYAAQLRYYGGAPHTGIDMVNDGDYTVKAVKSGTLYQGSIACGGGVLRYVRVDHAEGLNTYYLHVNY